MDTLSRRFTIVCLITAIFGMGLANIVAHTERPHRGQSFDAACKLSYVPGC